MHSLQAVAFQHIFVNYKKSEFYGPYFQTMLFLVTIFDISKLFIQCNTYSCCKPITGGADIYLYRHLSLLTFVYCVSLCVFVCVCVCLNVSVCMISNQNTSKKPHYVSDLSKLDFFCIKDTKKPFWYYVDKARHV